MRLSQIKLLYQNQHAIAFLLPELKIQRDLGLISGSDLNDIKNMQSINDHAIMGLMYNLKLDEAATQKVLAINTLLKVFYADFMQGKRQVKAKFGQSNENIQDFAQRFSPAAGWDRFGAAEWELMTKQALGNAPSRDEL